MSSLAETRRLTGWSRQPEPDALEDEGLWSDPISSTGCEVMRPSRLHGERRAHASDPNAKGECAMPKLIQLDGKSPCEEEPRRRQERAQLPHRDWAFRQELRRNSLLRRSKRLRVGLPKPVLENLAGGVARQRGHDLEPARQFVARELLAGELAQLL